MMCFLSTLYSCASAPVSRYITLSQNLNGEDLFLDSLQNNSTILRVKGLAHNDSRSISIGQNKTSQIQVLLKRYQGRYLLFQLFGEGKGWVQSAKVDHSFSFYQSSINKARTKVSCIDLQPIKNTQTSFSDEERYDYRIPFACQLKAESSALIWLLKFDNPSDNSKGTLKSNLGKSIEIQGVKRSSIENIGYKFILEGKTVALLSMVKDGQVTLSNELKSDTKGVILSAMSALIVEYGLVL